MDATAVEGKGAPLVVGAGNSFRRDDAAGLVAARRIGERAREVRVRLLEDEATDLLELWHGPGRVVLIDAVSSGAAPGTIHRFEADAGSLPSRFFRFSTHAISVAEAIELARALDQLPPGLVVYGIEGADFQAGTGLSPKTETAVSEVVERVLCELGDLEG